MPLTVPHPQWWLQEATGETSCNGGSKNLEVDWLLSCCHLWRFMHAAFNVSIIWFTLQGSVPGSALQLVHACPE